MAEFWRASGYDLLDRREDGLLAVTDAFLSAYLARPEMMPASGSCAAERALHATLLQDPRAAVTPVQLVAVKDKDARANFQIFLNHRDWLLRKRTIEAAYIGLFLSGEIATPRLFIDHMVAVILRGMLAECDDAMRVRAAELFYRPQRISLAGGQILAADEETVETFAGGAGLGSLGRLVVEAGTKPATIELDVMTPANAALYWERSDQHDMVLDLSFARPGLDALCRVLERWVAHFLATEVSIHPVQSIRDERWSWHVGLDSEATAILNDMYNGVEVDEARMRRVLALFRLEFRDPAAMLERVRGRPVYLAIAMSAEGVLKLKPQNLLVNLPIASGA
jgi:hypothetical protein